MIDILDDDFTESLFDFEANIESDCLDIFETVS